VNNNNGTWEFTPDAHYNGTVNLSYNVTDGKGGSTSATQSFTLAAVNDAPTGTATAQLATGIEDTAYIVSAADLLQGFSDADGDSLSVSALTTNNGSIINNGNATYTFTPNANYNGTVNLSYNVTDGKGGSTSATQSFTLAAINNPPIVVGQGIEDQIISVDQSFSLNVSTNFIDIDQGDTLTYSATGLPSGFSINANIGIVSGNTSNPGIFTVNITAHDGHGGTTSDAFDLIVANNNATTGNDIIYMSQLSDLNKDKVNAKAGNDRVIGTSANEFLGGAEGDDYLDGQGGNDKLLGGDGNDTLIGGLGNDDLQGNDGNDILIGWGSGTGSANQIDELKGGGGADIYILGNSTSVFYNFGGYNDYAKIVSFEAEDRIQLKGTASNYFLVSVPSSVSTDKSSVGIFTNSGTETELIAIIKNEGLNSTSLTTDPRFKFV
jgi:Ca2+-binding RTX toxin-like protein